MVPRKIGSSFAALLLLSCCLARTAPAQVAKRNQQAPVLTTSEIAARVKRSLVVVVTQDHDGNTVAQGSGFFIAPNLVATNLHVMKRASQGYVKSVSEDVTYKITEVQAFSLKRDISVLYLADAKGRPLPGSEDDAVVGEDILVAGNPEGLEATFSKGIVSAIRSQAGLLQIDAPISPGSSGGPVVNRHGEVIGLAVSSLTEGQNLNFATPIRVFGGHVLGRMAEGSISVETAGRLAVTDRENEGFHGIVKEFNESEASYTYDAVSDRYVRGPAVVGITQTFNQDGRLEDYQYSYNVSYNDQCMGGSKSEYLEDGIQDRMISIACDGKREVHELTLDEGIFYMTSRIHYDETVEGGSKSTNFYYFSKYDNRGLEVEDSNPGQNYKSVMKYDDQGRETEKQEYRDGKLATATHSTYEVNTKGDWIKRHETHWDARWPSLGFTPWVEQYREITYYSE